MKKLRILGLGPLSILFFSGSLIAPISRLLGQTHKDSLNHKRPAHTQVILIIKTETERGLQVIPENLLTVQDSGLKRSFGVIRQPEGLFKVHLPAAGYYKIGVQAAGYLPYQAWLRINHQNDSLLISLRPGLKSQRKVFGTSSLQAEKKSASNILQPDRRFELPLILTAIGLMTAILMIFFQQLKKLIIRLNKEVQQGLYITATLNKKPDKEPASLHYLQGEIMITAGPRKKVETGRNNDLDLGEDVCGLGIAKDTAWFWLLDGTSDQSSLTGGPNGGELFSSRLLAQGLAIEFKELLQCQVVVPELIYRSVEIIRQAWLDRIAGLSPEERQRLAALVLEKSLICSSTLLIGTLTTDGLCTAYRSGDSKMMIFGDDAPRMLINPLKERPGANNDRLFFRLIYIPDKGFEIECNRPRLETHMFHQINKLIAYSDGIGHELQAFLNAHETEFSHESRRLLPYLRNMTADDKSLCILERVAESKHLLLS